MALTETQETIIDGLEVRVTPMGAVDAAMMLAKLTRYAGAVMPQVREVLGGGAASVAKIDLFAFVEAISALMAAMPAEEFRALMLAFLARCTVVTGEIDARKKHDLTSSKAVDAAFEGKLLTMIKVLAHVLEVHYAGFIRGLVFGDSAREA